MAVVDLRPNGHVSNDWSPGNSGCAAGSTHLCIDDDPDSHDGDTTHIRDDEAAGGELFRVTMDNAPGDFTSTNSVTMKVACLSETAQPGDEIRFRLFALGSQVGGDKIFSQEQPTYILLSFTDAAWDSMTQAQIDDLEFEAELVLADEFQNIRVTAVELVLDYTTGPPPTEVLKDPILSPGIIPFAR